MSAAMTYDSLVQDIQTYCERTDSPFIDQIPRFIAMAENRICSESKPFGNLRTVTGTLSGMQLVKPVRWRKTKSFSILNGATRTYLQAREYEYCRTYWPDSTLTGVPKFYADYSYESFLVVPTPVSQYQFELQYYERPEPLDATTQVSWMTQYAPQVLLYACLLEAMPFLKTSERIPEFQGLYDRAIQAISKEDVERTLDNSSVRT